MLLYVLNLFELYRLLALRVELKVSGSRRTTVLELAELECLMVRLIRLDRLSKLTNCLVWRQNGLSIWASRYNTLFTLVLVYFGYLLLADLALISALAFWWKWPLYFAASLCRVVPLLQYILVNLLWMLQPIFLFNLLCVGLFVLNWAFAGALPEEISFRISSKLSFADWSGTFAWIKGRGAWSCGTYRPWRSISKLYSFLSMLLPYLPQMVFDICTLSTWAWIQESVLGMGLRHFSRTTRKVNCVNIAGFCSTSPFPRWRYITIIGVQICIREHSGLARINLILALEVNLRFGSTFLASFVNGVKLGDIGGLSTLRL